MSKYIMALDSGTTSNRCILFDAQGEICSVAQKEFTQIFPKPGWVEHDADEIFSTQLEVAKQALANIGATAADIAAIGITNQRETTIVWNKVSGQPVCNAIVWQCRRTAPYCDQLAAQGLVDTIRSKTGLVIDPYFSATKIRWILQNVPGAKEQAQAGELLFGTVETWLIWKLTGGRIHVTDYSNASRTMLFNINTLQSLAELHERLVASPKFPFYRAAYYKVLPYIVEIRNRGGHKDEGELQTCFDVLYGVMLLRLQKKPVTPETEAAVKDISTLLGQLSDYYFKDREDPIEW